MNKRVVLIPVTESPVALEAVRRVLRDDRESLLRIELVNVQPPLHRYISQWVSPAQRNDWRAERSRHALEPARRLVAEAGVACNLHTVIGTVPEGISELAKRLRVDEIVLASRRRGLLSRLLHNSPAARLLEFAQVPVRVIPSRQPVLDRLAVPAGVGLGIAALVVMAVD